MQSSGNANPELQMQAEKYVATGYQRLLTFEVDGGGFSLMGNPPAKVFLSAYGLMQFHDMGKVYPVDEAVAERAAKWLMAQQKADGTWDAGDYETRAGQGALGATSYVAWSLAEAGYRDTPQVSKAMDYIREFALAPSPSQGEGGGEGESPSQGQAKGEDAYTLALAANALAVYDPKDSAAQAVFARLYDLRVQDGTATYWSTSGGSFMGATGESGSLETTALVAYAFMRANVYPDAVNGALAYLVQGKDSWGTWSTTQATILSLKALLLSGEQAGQVEGESRVRISLNKEQTQEIVIDESNADVVHLVAFERGFAPSGQNQVAIELSGSGNLMYQVATRYYLPWDEVEPEPESAEMIDIDLGYDRTRLAVNDEVSVKVQVRLKTEGIVRLALVDLGVPPGFSVLSEDLSRLVEQDVIARYELTGRQIIVYLEDFTAETPVAFSYRLRARFPMRAQTPPSSAYDYYNPAGTAVRAPLEMRVEE